MSTDHTHPAGFDAPETFTIGDTRDGALKRLLSPVLIFPLVLGFLIWFMLSALFNVLGLPAFRLLALVGALVLTALLVVVWLKRTATSLTKTWLEVGPQGMSMKDGVITRTIAWQDMRTIGRVVPIRGVEASFGGSSAQAGAAVGAGVNRLAQQLSGTIGILGVGSLVPDQDSKLGATLVQQNQGVWGHDDSGAPLVGITPQDVENDWFNGRIGDWLRQYRPDLAAEYERQASAN